MVAMDWVGTGLLLVSLYLLGKKKRAGWLIGIFGNLAWMAVGLKIGMNSLLFVGFVMALFNVKGWLEWKES